MKTKQRYSDGLFLCDGENMFGNVIIIRGRGLSQNIRNADKRAGGYNHPPRKYDIICKGSHILHDLRYSLCILLVKIEASTHLILYILTGCQLQETIFVCD